MTSEVPASFEAALAELESIVSKMEGGQLPLKESLIFANSNDELPTELQKMHSGGAGPRVNIDDFTKDM